MKALKNSPPWKGGARGGSRADRAALPVDPHLTSPLQGEGPQFRRIEPMLLKRARALRKESTEAERMLWKKLCRRQTGFYFRRQYPVGAYIVDFMCTGQKLAIELDGGQHAAQQAYDAKRTAHLAKKRLPGAAVLEP